MYAVADEGIEVKALRILSLGLVLTQPGALVRKDEIAMSPSRFHQRRVYVPGWTRFHRSSTARVTGRLRRLAADVIIYTAPQYIDVAEDVRGPLCVYYAHDAFRFYDWDANTTSALERRMLDRADIVVAVSDTLGDDFRQMTRTPVIVSRDAVSKSFLDLLVNPLDLPEDLARVRRPIVGCTGNINRSYDWDLIGTLANRMPEVSFVFVGPISREALPIRQMIDSVLKLPNVRWLGAKPHERLPAYLGGFDICFNPLTVNEHSNRRSPLRLYDYLATDKPILSTAIREAEMHRPHIEVGRSAEQCLAVLRRFISRGYEVDRAARRRYIEANTWQCRASALLRALNLMQRNDSFSDVP